MNELLARMARESARRAASARSRESEAALLERALATRAPVPLVLAASGFDLIAEVKRRSPAAGALGRSGEDVVARARAYAASGAAAVSVLTEPQEFLGSLDDLREVARGVPSPVMRKDFLVDPYQVLEARAEGASGVLLILGILEDEKLGEMLAAASRLDLFVLLEAFDEADLARGHAAVERARALGLTLLFGLNARDLSTLAVDTTRFELLRSRLPRGIPWVAESGLATAEDAARVAALGYRLALVGSSLMRSPDPSSLISSMLSAARESPGRNIQTSGGGAPGPPPPATDGCRQTGLHRTRVVGETRKEPETSKGGFPDSRGRYGPFGGRFVPETLMPALARLEEHAREALQDPAFREALERELHTWVGRPTPLTEAVRLGKEWNASVWLKREDLAHTGAHKINNAVGQALLAARMKARRVIAETGAGQHGVATAAACARLGLPCTVYMGTVDIERQAPNVERMIRFGAKVVRVESGDRTLRAAIDEALRDWVSDPEGTFYLLGSAVGPHPYPWIVRELQAVIGREARRQSLERPGRLPDIAVASVGGGSNSIGLFHAFLEDAAVLLLGIEAGGTGTGSGENAATLSHGRPGVLHGSYSLLLQDEHGQVVETHSVSAGLDYPGVGPEHAYLQSIGRVRYETVGDEEALDATEELSAREGILPALESAHALAGARRWSARYPGRTILIGLSGRGDKDLATLAGRRPRD